MEGSRQEQLANTEGRVPDGGGRAEASTGDARGIWTLRKRPNKAATDGLLLLSNDAS